MPKERLKLIKEHFEKEALVFDEFFFRVMPNYEIFMQTLVEALGFLKKNPLEIIDLGCGTGNLAKKISAAFPDSSIACIDMAEKMLDMAKAKLAKNKKINFYLEDICRFNYRKKYDVIVSSMALHHVEKKEKIKLYRKLFNALNFGGVFCNIDIFVSQNPHLQEFFMQKWKSYMKQNGLSNTRINDMIKRHEREDRPVTFNEELSIMKKAGFKKTELLLKHYNFALYSGLKNG